MSNGKAPFQYQIHPTGDGSPTLSLAGGEKMHSMEGAFSESLYIYGPALEKAITLGSPRLLSMGLGIGYNEILAHGYLLSAKKDVFFIASFEKVTSLQSFFPKWMQGQETPLNKCYDEILNRVAAHFSLHEEQLKQEILKSFETQRLVIGEALPAKNPFAEKFHCVLYDAFSSATDSYLWSPEHLENILEQYCDPKNCWLSTYASTGDLKRALKKKGFLLEKKAGFGMKRESTFAHKTD